VPAIFVATKPTELLQSTGDPTFSPIKGTGLLWMSNSQNDIFMEISSNQLYVLIGGRWFTAKNLNGPWAYISGKKLPSDFKKIPDNGAMAGVLVSVPGTPQAREAVIAVQVPQTAVVQKNLKPKDPEYDGGKPEWKPINDTPMKYAVNCATPVIELDSKTYFMVQNGVWFSATSFKGPWTVATTVPEMIYTIPVSSPLHFVTYVRVYSSTASTVTVGYTTGYFGTLISSDGTIVYGTGYTYNPYVSTTAWYPSPTTYGFNAGFDYGYSQGFYFGFSMGAVMYPWGWYAPCCAGGIYMNINVTNIYTKWGSATVVTGPGGNRGAAAVHVGDTTFAKSFHGDDLYAGKDGQVYRRQEDGQWQKYNGQGQWSDINRNKPEPHVAENRQSLDNQFQSREAGNQRYQNNAPTQNRAPASGANAAPRGGGGARGGGGGGGFRGGGFRR
jgi:hypothetical protein